MAHLIRMPRAVWRRQPTGPTWFNPANPIMGLVHAGVSFAGGSERTYRCIRVTATLPSLVVSRDNAGGAITAVPLTALTDYTFYTPIIAGDTKDWTLLAILRRARTLTSNRSMVALWLGAGGFSSVALDIIEDDNDISGSVSNGITASEAPFGVAIPSVYVPFAVAYRQGVGLTQWIGINGGLKSFASNAYTNFYGSGTIMHGIRLGEPDANSGFVSEAYAIYGNIADETVEDWISNPHQIYQKTPARFILIPDGAGGASELAGAATGQATATGALTTQIPISAAALSVATAAGSIITAIPLAGSAAEITVASGVLTAQIQLSGAALTQIAAAGAVTTQIRLSGAALAQALATAGLTASPSGLTGDATAQAAASAGLTTQIPLAGSASAVASSSSALTTAIRLYGAAAQVSSATGDLTVASSTVLDAHALADATAGGSLMTQIRLNAQALATALAIGALSSASEWTASPQRTLRAVLQDRRLPAIRFLRKLTLT